MFSQKAIDLNRRNVKHIRLYACNKFGHVRKECRNKSMHHHRQYGKKPNKNIGIGKSKKYGSTKRKEKYDHIRCGLVVCSFEEKDYWYIDSGSSHHMTRYKSKIESLKKNCHDSGILGTDFSTKVIGSNTVRTNLGGTKCMKFQYSTFHMWIL